MKYFEVNFDGLVGPTHNYAGLARGNLASQKNRQSVSNPQKAALQGLEKMKLMYDLGIPQAFFPPHPAPHIDFLRVMGFGGSDRDIIEKISATQPELLARIYSSSSMWAANAAITTSSLDSLDGKVHFTPANLISNFHRSLEMPFTTRLLKMIFTSEKYFTHHDPAPAVFPDEGSANVVRLCEDFNRPSFSIFVYGREILNNSELALFNSDQIFYARQSREAFEILARKHCMNMANAIIVRQNENAIQRGVFHNDVISVGHKNVFLYHELAFQNSSETIRNIMAFFKLQSADFFPIQISSAKLSLEESVSTYLFNSQLVSTSHDEMTLISPAECAQYQRTEEIIQEIIRENNPVKKVHFIDLGESMKNGGGPACLRFRVVLNIAEWESINPAFIFTPSLYYKLKEWIQNFYRDKITPRDLADYSLVLESRDSLRVLSKILGLENLYEFT